MSVCASPLAGWRWTLVMLEALNNPVVQNDDEASRVLFSVLEDCSGSCDSAIGSRRLALESEVRGLAVDDVLRRLSRPGAPLEVIRDPSLNSRRRLLLRGHPGFTEAMRSLANRACIRELNASILPHLDFVPTPTSVQ